MENTFKIPAKLRGRPPKDTEPLEGISLSLPPSMIAVMKAERQGTGADSVSAVARLAIGDYLRRLDKRRTRTD